MTQVSKYPIHKDVEKRMFDVLVSTLSRLNGKEEIEDFLKDFLTPVEKIMLAKRLSIAVLLEKGYRYPSISGILRVTPATIAGVSVRLKYVGKGYKKVVERILKDENKDEFWQKLEDILVNIPASKGASLSRQRKEHEERKRKNRKAF